MTSRGSLEEFEVMIASGSKSQLWFLNDFSSRPMRTISGRPDDSKYLGKALAL